MTKEKPSSALKELINTNKVQLEVVKWVKKDKDIKKPERPLKSS